MIFQVGAEEFQQDTGDGVTDKPTKHAGGNFVQNALRAGPQVGAQPGGAAHDPKTRAEDCGDHRRRHWRRGHVGAPADDESNPLIFGYLKESPTPTTIRAAITTMASFRPNLGQNQGQETSRHQAASQPGQTFRQRSLPSMARPGIEGTGYQINGPRHPR